MSEYIIVGRLTYTIFLIMPVSGRFHSDIACYDVGLAIADSARILALSLLNPYVATAQPPFNTSKKFFELDPLTSHFYLISAILLKVADAKFN